MNRIMCIFIAFLCIFSRAEGLLFHGQTNVTSPPNGRSDPDVYKQLLHLENVLDSIMMDQKQQAHKFEQQQNFLEEEIQTLKQWNQTAQIKISVLESKNKILKERLNNLNTSSTLSQQEACLNEKLKSLNSTSTFLLQENAILKEQVKTLNSTSIFIQRNLITSEDLRKMERILTFEIEQTIRIREQEMMKNISATVTDLELRDRYLTLSVLDVLRNMTLIDNTLSKLMQQQKKNEEQQNSTLQHLSLSVFDVHRNMTSLSYILSKFKQQQNTNEEQQNMIIQNLSLSLLDVHNNTAELSSSLSSLDAQQKQMKSEIQTVTNSQQNDITKLNDTIIHLKNHVQSKVAFTAGILREYGGHAYTGTVQFPTVIYQVGGGYDPTTGIFTAPKAGLYLIFCTNVALNHETFWTKIMINGSFKAGVMAYVGSSSMLVYQSGSNLVVHQLQVGDRVWIEVRSGSHLYSDVSETLFSVIMINGSD